jgi:hypothetical protein
MMADPIVIRASALSTYPDCPRRAAARLFRREIEAAGFRLRRTPRGIGAVIGSAVHAAAAMALSLKAKTGDLPSATVTVDFAAESLTESLAQGEVTFDAPHGVTHNRDDASKQTISLTSAYRRAVAPSVQPIIVEERLEAEISPGIVLSGTPDVVAREPGAVRDLKTGARSAGSHAPQLGAYSLLSRAHGLAIETASVDFIRRVGAHKPQPDPISKTVRIADAETAASSIIKHIEGDLSTFRNGDPARRILPGDPWAFQANPASILCSPKWCPAFGTEFCHEGDPAKESG